MTFYILEGTEVRLTGRTAQKKNGDKVLATLVEVTPHKRDDGDWTRWVRQLDLFEVIEPENTDE